MTETFKREMKYIVIKNSDVEKYLEPKEKGELFNLCTAIDIGRTRSSKKLNSYVVVNMDEPYAEKVWKLIEDHWFKNKYNLPYCQDIVLKYLLSKNCFVSPTEIGNNVGGFSLGGLKRSSAWSCRILKRLIDKGLVIKNEKGFYRYKS